MKMKTLLSLAIVMSMMLAALPLLPYASARDMIHASDPVVLGIIFVDSGTNVTSKLMGTNFVVNVTLSIPDGINMDFWDLEIHWNPAQVALQHGTTADVVEGPFMKAWGTTIMAAQDPDNVLGILPDIACGFTAGGPVVGPYSGVICQIKFTCVGEGVSIIDLFEPNNECYLLYGVSGIFIDAGYDGQITQTAPPATPPTAVIVAPSSVPVGATVTLDGSTSANGFDTLPTPGTACPITTWNWHLDFVYTDGTPPKSLDLSGMIVTFDCDGPGTVTVTLTVIAPDPVPPTSGTYVDHDDAQKVITQFTPAPPPSGPFIDVYVTNNGDINGTYGSNPPYDMWADAYGPQQLVCVEAKVSYNDEPVEYKPVAFEVIDAHGVSRDYRVVFTDENGLAGYCFRLPWEGKDAEAQFGDWHIVATVDIAENIVSDTVWFRFGYILSITDLSVLPTYPNPVYKLGSLTINVTVLNIAFTSKLGLLTVVAYDNCSVPIGKATTPGLFVFAPGTTPNVFTIIIPKWAFVGTGTVYGNIFTKAPSAGGVPYCPEESALFYLAKTP
jgi:hypothetical protein